MQTTLDRFGRVVIPKDVREELGLEPGTVLRVEGHRDEIHLKPMNAIPQTKLKAGVLVFSGEATGDLIGAVRRHREERKKKAGSTRGRR